MIALPISVVGYHFQKQYSKIHDQNGDEQVQLWNCFMQIINEELEFDEDKQLIPLHIQRERKLAACILLISHLDAVKQMKIKQKFIDDRSRRSVLRERRALNSLNHRIQSNPVSENSENLEHFMKTLLEKGPVGLSTKSTVQGSTQWKPCLEISQSSTSESSENRSISINAIVKNGKESYESRRRSVLSKMEKSGKILDDKMKNIDLQKLDRVKYAMRELQKAVAETKKVPVEDLFPEILNQNDALDFQSTVKDVHGLGAFDDKIDKGSLPDSAADHNRIVTVSSSTDRRRFIAVGGRSNRVGGFAHPSRAHEASWKKDESRYDDDFDDVDDDDDDENGSDNDRHASSTPLHRVHVEEIEQIREHGQLSVVANSVTPKWAWRSISTAMSQLVIPSLFSPFGRKSLVADNDILGVESELRSLSPLETKSVNFADEVTPERE